LVGGDLDGGVSMAVLAPAFTMLVGSASVFSIRVPAFVQACTQNFSAGLLISAVAGELFPLMSRPETAAPHLHPATEPESSIGLLCGFVTGLIFMFGLEHFTEGHGEDDEKGGASDTAAMTRELSDEGSACETPMLEGEQAIRALEAMKREADVLSSEVVQLQRCLPQGSRERIDEMVHAMEYRVDKAKRVLTEQEPLDERNIARMQFHLGELADNCKALASPTTVQEARSALRKFQKTLDHIHKHAERMKFRRWNPAPKPSEEEMLSEQLPLALAFAVTVDASVDGLLIGLAFFVAPSAGWCMSIATCIEMGFLGLSFSASVQNATRSLRKHALLVAVPPAVLALTGVSGHMLGGVLSESPGLFIGFVAFSIVALLFLVTQELLSEAREMGGNDVRVNIMLFVGLLSGIFLEKALG